MPYLSYQFNFLYQLFGCFKANVETLRRRQPHSPALNHCAYLIRPEVSLKILCLSARLILNVWPRASVKFEPRTFQFWVNVLLQYELWIKNYAFFDIINLSKNNIFGTYMNMPLPLDPMWTRHCFFWW